MKGCGHNHKHLGRSVERQEGPSPGHGKSEALSHLVWASGLQNGRLLRPSPRGMETLTQPSGALEGCSGPAGAQCHRAELLRVTVPLAFHILQTGTWEHNDACLPGSLLKGWWSPRGMCILKLAMALHPRFVSVGSASTLQDGGEGGARQPGVRGQQ